MESNWTLGGKTLDSMTLAARMDGRSIMIDRFQVAVTPKETIDGNGTIDLDRSAYEVRLSSEGVSLASIHGAGGPDQISGKVVHRRLRQGDLQRSPGRGNGVW